MFLIINLNKTKLIKTKFYDKEVFSSYLFFGPFLQSTFLGNTDPLLKTLLSFVEISTYSLMIT